MLAYIVEKEDENIISGIKEIDVPVLQDYEILIKTSYSSINYKDALSSIGNPGVTRKFPHITGIDVSGVVVESKSSNFNIGDEVVVTGYDFGMNTDGGHSQFVKVKDSWAIKIPSGLDLKTIMVYGTAGLTAALSLNELQNNGINNQAGKILVTGSTGGVGSVAVAILSKLGYKVCALTSKKEQSSYLTSIGASEVIYKEEFLSDIKRPLYSQEFAGVIDTVGGDILAKALKATKYDGVITCCGLTASAELNVNVFPFILRGVRLIGIDSVECELDKKEKIWKKLSNEYSVNILDKITNEITIDKIKNIYEQMLLGKVSGRYIVKF